MRPVQMGDGGRASDYSFDASTGLSSDSRLAYYLQDLTPAQLQSALDGGDPGPEVRRLLQLDQNSGTLASCLTNYDPAFCGPRQIFDGVPMWAWLAGGGVLALLLVKK